MSAAQCFRKFLNRLSRSDRPPTDGRRPVGRAQATADLFADRANIDLNHVVNGMVPELERVLGDRIELRTILARRPVIVSSNAPALEHILLSIALNARDVMGNGGRLTIETTRVDPPDDPMHFRQSSPGRGCLAVSNTVIGSFGLASAAYTANQLEGRLLLESRPGTGTRISFELPLANET